MMGEGGGGGGHLDIFVMILILIHMKREKDIINMYLNNCACTDSKAISVGYDDFLKGTGGSNSERWGGGVQSKGPANKKKIRLVA